MLSLVFCAIELRPVRPRDTQPVSSGMNTQRIMSIRTDCRAGNSAGDLIGGYDDEFRGRRRNHTSDGAAFLSYGDNGDNQQKGQ